MHEGELIPGQFLCKASPNNMLNLSAPTTPQIISSCGLELRFQIALASCLAPFYCFLAIKRKNGLLLCVHKLGANKAKRVLAAVGSSWVRWGGGPRSDSGPLL